MLSIVVEIQFASAITSLANTCAACDPRVIRVLAGLNDECFGSVQMRKIACNLVTVPSVVESGKLQQVFYHPESTMPPSKRQKTGQDTSVATGSTENSPVLIDASSDDSSSDESGQMAMPR